MRKDAPPQRRFIFERVNKIIELTRIPYSTEQISCMLDIDLETARRYIKHMIESEALIVDHKVKKRAFYKSTSVYKPPSPQETYTFRDISVRRPIKTNIKPFRDEWTELFFGPVLK